MKNKTIYKGTHKAPKNTYLITIKDDCIVAEKIYQFAVYKLDYYFSKSDIEIHPITMDQYKIGVLSIDNGGIYEDPDFIDIIQTDEIEDYLKNQNEELLQGHLDSELCKPFKL